MMGATLEEQITQAIEKGAETYKTYAEKEVAEAQAEAAKADAERAKAQAAAAAAAAGVKPPEKKILGIPVSYLLYGGAALGAVALVVTLLKGKKKK
jgi:hypothetical protein